ncbi:nudix-type nucleoside diphosphatase, YffH/AdpP family [Cribrihabitans marinus]|uniref:ADP-ribose pyrophosphatase n=1 Tax=Cribrihabitans marinus TaxID=1227549 RepID=A0A1H6QRP0_9RHOB|nr:NUDIX domain-containing protein [Cribrihabitans marinus]GGH18694.1 tellurite resistance protein [Cribrihabitans marinus]SEI42140.1 nudix-type nucleoside diphosphatase, YffH/AdpP family [Cribrihabitans marinus]
MDLAFYGTLCFAPLLEIVLGRPAAEVDMAEVALPGHAVLSVRDQPFPMIVADPEASARGLLVRDLSETDLARLAYYEGGFDYDLRICTVRRDDGTEAQARVFFPPEGKYPAGPPWVLEDWVRDWGPMTLHAAREVMAFFGRRSAAEIARSFPAIRTRAAARLAAEARPADPERDFARDVVVDRHDRAYLNYFGLDEIELRHRRNSGGLTERLTRAALMQGQAAVVLPYDPVRDTVLLVEQFRAPVYMIGDPAPWIWEPVAGMVDPGETPEQAARREALEEAHLELGRLEPAGRAYSSTGSSTEFLHLFVGLADLTETTENGGVESEGEDIRSAIVPFADLMRRLDAFEVNDMPLVALANWLARHRDRLRAGG